MRAIPRPPLPAIVALAVCMAAVSFAAGELADNVAAAFRDSNARGIRSFLPREGRVFVALPVLDVKEGFVGSDQLYYLLDQLFERTKTVAFEVTSTEQSDADTLYVHARWKLEDEDGREHTLRLSITLSQDQRTWAIRELRGGRG